MTMKFLQQVGTEIVTNMPDNSVGAITPAIMRVTLQDMLDSLYPRSAAVVADRAAVPVAQALTTVPTNYPALYNGLIQTDPAVVAGNVAAGTIIPNKTGFVCEALIGFTCYGANGRVVTANLAKNGVVQDRFKVAATMSGGVNLDSANTTLPLIGVTAGDVFTLLLSVDTAASITFAGVRFLLRVLPTFSAL